MDVHDARMIKRRQHLAFGQETLAMQLDVFAFDRKDLERTMRPELEMLHLVNRAHSAAAERTNDAIRPYCPAELKPVVHAVSLLVH